MRCGFWCRGNRDCRPPSLAPHTRLRAEAAPARLAETPARPLEEAECISEETSRPSLSRRPLSPRRGNHPASQATSVPKRRPPTSPQLPHRLSISSDSPDLSALLRRSANSLLIEEASFESLLPRWAPSAYILPRWDAGR